MLLQSVKSVIKFLIKDKFGYQTVHTLNIDFYNYTGQYIPFFELGYRSLVIFLKNIPDILKVNELTLEVQPVRDKSVDQINKPTTPTSGKLQCAPYASVFQCCHWMPLYQPRVLPWVRSSSNNGKNERESNEKLYRAITKNRNKFSIRDECDNTVLSKLGRRTYGDGKCSSSDSLNNKTDSKLDVETDRSLLTTSVAANDGKNCSTENISNFDKNPYGIMSTISTELDRIKLESADNMESGAMSSISAESSAESDDFKVLSNKGDSQLDEETERSLLTTSETNSVETNEKYCSQQENISNCDKIGDDHQSGVLPSESEFGETSFVSTESDDFKCEELTDDDAFEQYFETNNETGFRSPDSAFNCNEPELNITPPPAYSDIAADDYSYFDPNEFSETYYCTDSTESINKMPKDTKDEEAIPFHFDDNDFIHMIDSKYSDEKYGSSYQSISVDTALEVGRFYELYISEVNSPYKFWFQLADESPNPIDNLQEDLNLYYNIDRYQNQDVIQRTHMVKGYACAALYAGSWYRCELVDKPRGETVKVFFIDFGTVDQVSVNDVRYLLDSFCSIPKLCHRGTLDFVKPKSNYWSFETVSYFLSLVRNTKLVAGVSEIDLKTNSARLYLMDRQRNIIVNHKLVFNGYAFPDDPRERYRRHIADAVPTFDSLETGQFPSLDEAVVLLEKGFDIHRELESCVIDGVNCYIPQYLSNEEAFQLVAKFKKEIEEGKKLAAERDASIFLQIFGSILTNPFLNGKMVNKVDDFNNDLTTNPFLN